MEEEHSPPWIFDILEAVVYSQGEVLFLDGRGEKATIFVCRQQLYCVGSVVLYSYTQGCKNLRRALVSQQVCQRLVSMRC